MCSYQISDRDGQAGRNYEHNAYRETAIELTTKRRSHEKRDCIGNSWIGSVAPDVVNHSFIFAKK